MTLLALLLAVGWMTGIGGTAAPVLWAIFGGLVGAFVVAASSFGVSRAWWRTFGRGEMQQQRRVARMSFDTAATISGVRPGASRFRSSRTPGAPGMRPRRIASAIT